MTDGLFSTRSLQIKHDGASFNRIEKTALVARHAIALSHLHVCWKDGAASNCGRCAKCVRTIATLRLLGALDRATTFPEGFGPEIIARLYIENTVEASFFEEIRDMAAHQGDRDIEAATAKALRRSSHIRPLVKLADRLSHAPFVWRLGPQLRRWCVG
jgi:hypothetical protein